MFDTPLNTLYSVLALAILLLTVFLVIGINYLILILRDLSHVTSSARKTADKIDRWIIEPVKLIKEIRQKILAVSEFVGEKRRKRKKK